MESVRNILQMPLEIKLDPKGMEKRHEFSHLRVRENIDARRMHRNSRDEDLICLFIFVWIFSELD